MTDPELRQLALDYVAGKVFTTSDIPQNLWYLVFMPLAFANKTQLRGVRMVLGQADKHRTTGQGINGYPIFFECQMLKRRDTLLFTRYVGEAKKVTAAFVGAKDAK